jgi:isoleucyl-tRNA synthetase
MTMSGKDAPYLPGWDCHGLPIEHKVMGELGEAALSMSPLEIRRKCRDYALTYAGLQSEQFQRLGVIGQFEAPYLTMNPHYEAAVLELFAQLIDQGLVYRALKPVHWSIENRTALADAELEYADRDDPSVYVLFDVTSGDVHGLPHREGDRIALMIWTTTPWTLPANKAVAVHPEFVYSAVHAESKTGPTTFFVARELTEAVLQAVTAAGSGSLAAPEVLGQVTGQQLLDAGLRYALPLREAAEGMVVPADYVVLDQGTGLVHTAPGHGAEDFMTGTKFGIDVYNPVRADGTYDDTVPEWLRGQSVWDANPQVVERLAETGHLAQVETLRHSYPHDWRSKTPTIFRATEQWFVSVDSPRKEDGRSLRDAALAKTGHAFDDGGADFVPGWGRARMAGMLEARPDWCISRQRVWGLPIPVFFNASEQSLLTAASVRAVARVFRERGSDAWYELEPAELLAGYDPQTDPELKDPGAFSLDQLHQGSDIFDVWFESGSSWYAVVMEEGLAEDIPIDLYLEGSDQHRGWFQLSMLLGLASRGQSPFETVVTHGFIVTEDGHKMSKSLGNTIDVIEQLEKRGADILRLWLSSQDYHNDVRCSEALISQSEDAYRKIRNTLRFLMGGCFDFEPSEHAEAPRSETLEFWFRMELHKLIREVRRAFETYEFHRGYRAMYEFCTIQASSVYLSAVKDRLYCDAPDSPRRRAAQTVMHEALTALIKLLAPIIPHTAEEAWSHIPHRAQAEPENLHLALLPDPDPGVLAVADAAGPAETDLGRHAADARAAGPAWVWERLLELRSEGLLKLEAIRNAGVKAPLDTEAVFRVDPANEALAALLEAHLGEMEDLLGVGFARIEREPPGDAGTVEILDARERYPRCERSWKRRPDVGSDAAYPGLSARDAAAVKAVRES